ncbi:MAG: hypothetical protein KKC46_01700 [Proteobacteria bacterium]|nr:hypothetical protein [Pseudomonadota bacterium]
MRKRILFETCLCMFVIMIMLAIFSANATAKMTTSFHGYIESNFVLRDADGIQYGFFDEAYGVQQRNTLKFDIDIEPDINFGSFIVGKVHLTFRGAYDSIFDLRSEDYDITGNMGASRFDYGEDDIKYESDLREAFIDFVYTGDYGGGFFRPGRQIVSWGEGSLETLLDVINPPDMSYNLFFQKPDDVKTPLWMGRINYDLPRFASTSINFDLLWIPDIRPTQFGPLDSEAGNPQVGLESPYVSITAFSDFKGIFNIREDVPTNNNEYGARVRADISDRLTLSLVYFRDVVNEPGILLVNKDNTPTAILTHNKQHVYGGYFSYQLLLGRFEAIVRGEISRYTAYPINLPRSEYHLNPEGTGTMTFEYRPVTKALIAIDKDLRLKWLSRDLSQASFEWLHKTINEWDSKFSEEHLVSHFEGNTLIPNTYSSSRRYDRRNVREQDVFMFRMRTSWWASKLVPAILVAYNPGKHGEGGTGMTRFAIKWSITSQFYTTLRLQAFVGDDDASYAFSDGISTTEASVTFGYEW